MVWCKHCAKPRDTIRDPDDGFLCCTTCGKVVYQDIFSNDIVFIKGAEGQSHMAGNFVKTVQSEYSESHNRTLEKGRGHISDMVDRLCIGGGDSIVNPAFSFYKIAVERNFTRGRRTDWVAAACLYIACREQKKAYLLIDFSEHLQTNVYVIGAVFLQLCKLLRLEEHPIVQKPVDPSLFIHRFTDRLLGGQKVEVSRTALRIIASMKRDWMQTGRKPSGICGAALYISALSHGLKYSKSDVVRVVHICEATLTKRLIEFENTESGSLTIEEFNMKAEELEGEVGSYRQPNADSGLSGELLCEHKDSGKTHFAHGLCHSCFDDFIKLSGGLQGGSEPPAFQRAERERMAKASVEDKMTESTDMNSPCQNETNNKHVGREEEVNSQVLKNEGLASIDPESTRFDTGKPFNSDGACDKPHGSEDMDTIAGDESETFSDIDDSEVNGYLHNEEEKRYKKIIWEEMNREYLEEQAAKEAAAAAKVASEANFQGCPEDFLAAKELAAAAAAAVAKSRKDKQQKRAAEAKNGTPAQTPAEATRQMLAKKRLSSKINYDVLEKLFDDSTAPTTKKKRADLPPETDANEDLGSKTEPESDVVDNNEDLGHQDEEGYTEAAYGDESYEFEDGYYCDDDNDYV